MTLLTTKNCSGCEKVKELIKDKKISIEVEEVNKEADKYYYKTKQLPDGIAFPVLYFGEDKNGKSNYLIGEEGISSFLQKGYVNVKDNAFCPFIKKSCIEKKCARFSILYKGLIPEAACSDYWIPVLMTEKN